VVAGLVERERPALVTVVSVAVEVDAPPEAVWAVVSNPRNLPHWDRHIVAVEGLPEDGLGGGVAYITVMRFMALRARVRAEVLEWSPPARSRIRLSGLLEATVDTKVSPLPGGRSRLEHHVDYRFKGGALGELAARSLRLVGGSQLALRRGTMAQKREIESRR